MSAGKQQKRRDMSVSCSWDTLGQVGNGCPAALEDRGQVQRHASVRLDFRPFQNTVSFELVVTKE